MAQPLGFLFSGHEYTECRTQGPEGKMYEGKTTHDLATRDESVKRGGGSVVVLRNSQNNIKVSLRSDISVSPCVVSPNLLYRGFHVIHRAGDLQIAVFL